MSYDLYFYRKTPEREPEKGLSGFVKSIIGTVSHSFLRCISRRSHLPGTGAWSPGKPGEPLANLAGHAMKHHELFGFSNPPTESQVQRYLSIAKTLINKKTGVNVYYDKTYKNLVVYDLSTKRYVAMNDDGTLATLLYKNPSKDAGRYILIPSG